MPPRKFFIVDKNKLDEGRIEKLFPATKKVGRTKAPVPLWKTEPFKFKYEKHNESTGDNDTHEIEVEVTYSANTNIETYKDEIASLKKIPTRIAIVSTSKYKEFTGQEKLFATVEEHMLAKDIAELKKQEEEDMKEEEDRETQEERFKEIIRESKKNKTPKNDRERADKIKIMLDDLKEKMEEDEPDITEDEMLNEIKKAYRTAKGLENREVRLKTIREFRKIFEGIEKEGINYFKEEEEEEEGKKQEKVREIVEPTNPLALGEPRRSFPSTSVRSRDAGALKFDDDDEPKNAIQYKIVSNIPHSEFSHLKRLRAVQPIGVQFHNQFLKSTYFGHLNRYMMQVQI